jgi:hypothetical protein
VYLERDVPHFFTFFEGDPFDRQHPFEAARFEFPSARPAVVHFCEPDSQPVKLITRPATVFGPLMTPALLSPLEVTFTLLTA